MCGILVEVVVGNSAFLFLIECIHLGCKLVKMMELAQALPPCDHTPAEVNQIISPCSECFFLKVRVQGALAALVPVMGIIFLQAKGTVLQMLI